MNLSSCRFYIYGFKPVLPGLSGEKDKPPVIRVPSIYVLPKTEALARRANTETTGTCCVTVFLL